MTLVIDMQTYALERSARREEPTYPDEVLDAEWNPELARIQPVELPHDAPERHSVEPPRDILDGDADSFLDRMHDQDRARRHALSE